MLQELRGIRYLPSEHVHVEIAHQVGAVDDARQGLVGLQQPREMCFHQLLIVLVRPQHPLPIWMCPSASGAPPLEFCGQFIARPALVEELGYCLQIFGDRSL